MWKPIPNYEDLYLVSNSGNIMALPRLKHTPLGGTFMSKEKILKPTKTYRGYLVVSLWKNAVKETKLVHVLVATCFCGNPLNEDFVNHEDGIKTNNYYKNLKWCNRSYNMLHAFSTGLIKKTRRRNVSSTKLTAL